MSDTSEAVLADFRRTTASWESELRQQFKLRGAVKWGTQLVYDKPWYNPPLAKEAKLFIFFFANDDARARYSYGLGRTVFARRLAAVRRRSFRPGVAVSSRAAAMTEIGHYCVPLRTVTVFDEPRHWHDSFLANVRMRSIDDEIPAVVLDWRAV